MALEAGGILTGGEGVLRLVVGQPMGRAMLGALAFGFAAVYAIGGSRPLLRIEGEITSPGSLPVRDRS